MGNTSLLSLYNTNLSKILLEPHLDDANSIENRKLRAIHLAQTLALRCDSVDDVMSRLLSSERVYTDLLLALDAADEDQNDIWGTYLALRSWNKELNSEMEFRCFIYQGQLVAISQYNHYIMLPYLQGKEEYLRDKIFNYWKLYVSDKLHQNNYDSYVCDIAILNSGDCIVIELNPYATSTGGSMLDWTSDHDILHGYKNDEAKVSTCDTSCNYNDVYVTLPHIRLRESIIDYIEDYVKYQLECIELAAKEENKSWIVRMDEILCLDRREKDTLAKISSHTTSEDQKSSYNFSCIVS
jgi:hypothetical protein